MLFSPRLLQLASISLSFDWFKMPPRTSGLLGIVERHSKSRDYGGGANLAGNGPQRVYSKGDYYLKLDKRDSERTCDVNK